MQISPDQAALYAQVAPVFMVLSVGERFAILRVFSSVPARLQATIGPALVALVLAFAIVTMYGIQGVDEGIKGGAAFVASWLFLFGVLAVVYVATVVIYAEARRARRED